MTQIHVLFFLRLRVNENLSPKIKRFFLRHLRHYRHKIIFYD